MTWMWDQASSWRALDFYVQCPSLMEKTWMWDQARWLLQCSRWRLSHKDGGLSQRQDIAVRGAKVSDPPE